ncbi:hypothetical protein CCGE531_03275 [Rhizobium sp. CCGE531]|nr:hypothetical protein CCGE531_03275 [Rhizobium sp. CCGE531]AYG71599.1 hypothetical protein CCGE532_03265 [Rhizobium sp. CCGE532]
MGNRKWAIAIDCLRNTLLPTAYCLLPTAYCLPPPHLRRLCRLSPPECPRLPPEACVLPDGALPNPVNEC